jgi:hypothetical protein
MDEQEVEKSLMEFAKKMINEQRPLDADFARIFHDYSYDLYA